MFRLDHSEIKTLEQRTAPSGIGKPVPPRIALFKKSPPLAVALSALHDRLSTAGQQNVK
jgi:hypothetical protein